MRNRIWLFMLMIMMLIPVSPAASAEILATEYVLSGRNVYSPTVLRTVNGVRRVWFGGWLNDGDRTDRIYMSDEAAPGAWTAPVVVLERPGQLVNDPTVLRHPIYPTWLFMYFTVLTDPNDTSNNQIGFASSIDEGRSWWDHGIIIGRDNGLDQCGAWSPSALVVGSEIWVYFHGNLSAVCSSLQVYRVRLDLNGWQRLATEIVTLPGPVLNVDVNSQQGQFVLWADAPDLRAISRYISTDGLTFMGSPGAPVINAGAAMINTPHCEVVSNDLCRLWFGFSPSGSVTDFSSIHDWTISAP